MKFKRKKNPYDLPPKVSFLKPHFESQYGHKRSRSQNPPEHYDIEEFAKYNLMPVHRHKFDSAKKGNGELGHLTQEKIDKIVKFKAKRNRIEQIENKLSKLEDRKFDGIRSRAKSSNPGFDSKDYLQKKINNLGSEGKKSGLVSRLQTEQDLVENLETGNLDEKLDQAYLESINAKVELLLNPNKELQEGYDRVKENHNHGQDDGLLNHRSHSPAVSYQSRRHSTFNIPQYKAPDYDNFHSPYEGFSFLTPGLKPRNLSQKK